MCSIEYTELGPRYQRGSWDVQCLTSHLTQSPRDPSQGNALLCWSEVSESFKLRDASSFWSSKVSIPKQPARLSGLVPWPLLLLSTPESLWWVAKQRCQKKQGTETPGTGHTNRGPEAGRWCGVARVSGGPSVLKLSMLPRWGRSWDHTG